MLGFDKNVFFFFIHSIFSLLIITEYVYCIVFTGDPILPSPGSAIRGERAVSSFVVIINGEYCVALHVRYLCF